jgi:hypothetical protein
MVVGTEQNGAFHPDTIIMEALNPIFYGFF